MIYKLNASEIAKAVVDYLRKKKVEGSDSPYYTVVMPSSEKDNSFWAEVSFREVKLGGDIG